MPTLKRTASILLLSLVALPGALQALQVDDAKSLNDLLDSHQKQIHTWEHSATILLVFTIVIGVSGPVTTLLQKFNANWSKISTATLGLAIGVLTVISNTMFDGNRDTLRNKAVEAKKIVDSGRIMISEGIPRLDNPNRDAWFNEYRKILDQLYDLEKQQQKNADSAAWQVVPSVYAQASKAAPPAWTTTPPVDRQRVYFVGEAANASLSAARDLAMKDARARASAFLASQFQGASRGLQSQQAGSAADFVLRSAQEQDSYFAYDAGTQGYRYFVLLSLSRDAAQSALQVYRLNSGVSVSSSVLQSDQRSYPPKISTPPKQITTTEGRFLPLNDTLSMYIGEIRKSQPVRVIIFETNSTPPIDTRHKFTYSSAKARLAGGSILLDQAVSSGEAVTVGRGTRPVRVSVALDYRAVGHDRATITVQE